MPRSFLSALGATFLALVLLVPFAARAADAPPSLQAFLGFAHATELAASPVGDRIAWVQMLEGVRNVWVTEGPDWRGRALTAYSADDGQAISDLQFTPDGQSLLFLRGGAPNRDGELPNPASDPEGVKRQLWLLSLADEAAPKALVETGRFAPFPDGQRVAYLKGKQLHVLDVAVNTAAPALGGEASAEATNTAPQEAVKPLFEVRRGVSEFAIAPDGQRIAFVSARGDHTFVGVYHLDQQSLLWMAPSLDHDRYPVWSPDSSQLAFVRIPNEKQILPFVPRREGLPWSIRVADPATGASREIFKADEGAGSAFQPGYWFVGDRLWWGSDNRIVFPWEKTGWLHMWSIASSGGEPVDLTPGEGEVQYAELAPDGAAMLMSVNHNDLHRRQVWQTSVVGGQPQALTAAEGIAWAPRRTGEGTLAFLASDAHTAAHPVVLQNGQPLLPASKLPALVPAAQRVAPELVSFPAADGMKIHAQLFRPPAHCGPGPHPGLLFFHGGSRRQMLLGFHPSSYYANAFAFNQAMAARCFVVASVNYRSGVGYGMAFREALDYGAQGASEYRDVVGAGLYLAAREDVDATRIGLWGGSYGGYLTALGLARASDLFAAGVDLHGVHDWNVVIGNFASQYDPGAREAFARVAFESSPMADIQRWRSPVLLIHGDDDRNVPFSESVDLAEALRRNGTPVESLVFADEVHGFLLHRNWLSAFTAAEAFLQRELGAGGGQGAAQ